MPGSLSIRISDSATPALQALAAELHGEPVRKVMARAGVAAVKSHFYDLDRDPSRANKLGAPRQHFFGQAARATNFQISNSGFVISINHIGVALRYFGGTVRPVNAKFLTLPATAAAYGKRAREFPDLEAHFPKKSSAGAGFLYRVTGGRGKNQRMTILFWLVKKSTIHADTTILPEMSALVSLMCSAADSYIKRTWERSHAA